MVNMCKPTYLILLFVLKIHGQLKNYNNHCSVITIPMCLKIPYNTTRMPNLLQHRTQEEAAIMAHEFLPLVDIKCSPFARFFICSVYAPMCTEKIPYGVPSCRSVCQAVKDACLPVLRTLNLTWPKFLPCDSFPREREGLCMVPPDLSRTRFKDGLPSGVKPRLSSLSAPQFTTPPPRLYKPDLSSRQQWLAAAHSPGRVLNHKDLCLGSRLWIQTGKEDGLCVPLCGNDFLFAAKDKRVAMAWASSWAIVSLLSTSFSLLTFCLDRTRFDYPERPVICLALSYLCYSISYIVRLTFPSSVLSCEIDPTTGQNHLATTGISSPGCIVTFLLQYYFGMASEVWWTILTFCWFMTACRFWVAEVLNTYATYFHATAWGLPALASVTAIAMKQVNGDELLGMCFVGTMDTDAQLYLVILPQSLLLSLGTIFISVGLVSLFRIRNTFKKEFSWTQNAASSPASSLTTLPPSTSPSTAVHGSIPTVRLAVTVTKLERLMVRLGVFSVLSTVPAIFVLACRLRAYFKQPDWTARAAGEATSCKPTWNEQGCSLRQSFPEVEMDLLRIFMSLIIGVTSGIWVWSTKTINLWKMFILKLLGLKPSTNFLKPMLDQQIILGQQRETPIGAGDPRGYVNFQESLYPLIGEREISRTRNHPRSSGSNLPNWGPVNDSDKGPAKFEITTSFV